MDLSTIFNRSTTQHLRPKIQPIYQVAVRIAEEAADLSAPVDRRRQEDGTTCLERLIGNAAVGHTKRQFMADAIRIRRRPESDRGLVPGRPAAGNKEQP